MQHLGPTPQTGLSFIVFILCANLAEYQVCYLATFSEGDSLAVKKSQVWMKRYLGFMAQFFNFGKTG